MYFSHLKRDVEAAEARLVAHELEGQRRENQLKRRARDILTHPATLGMGALLIGGLVWRKVHQRKQRNNEKVKYVSKSDGIGGWLGDMAKTLLKVAITTAVTARVAGHELEEHVD